MTARSILILNNTGLRALRWQHGVLHEESVFSADEAGVNAFATYVQGHLRDLFYLLADVADESFQFDKIPHVRGKDRAALIRRRKDQFFFGSPFSIAMPMGREQEGRRDDRMLFAALTRPAQLEPWLNILRAGEAQLVGIYSAGFVAQHLLEKQTAHEHQVLLTITRGGLRQSHFVNGRLQFSRLTTFNEPGNIDDVAQAIPDESAKIHSYLSNHRLITRNTALPIVILAHPAQREAFQAYCKDTDNLRFEFLDLLAVAKRIGLKQAPADSLADDLLAQLLPSATPRFQFADEVERHQYRLWQVNRALRIAAALFFLSATLFTVHRLATIWSLAHQGNTLQDSALADQTDYDNLVKTLPSVGVTPDNLRAVIGRWDDLQHRSPPMEFALNEISLALAATPQIELQNLDWRLANAPDQASAPAGRSVAASGAQGPPGAYVITDIDANLPASLNQNQRAQLALIDRFADALRKTRNSEVRITKQPFDTESGKALKSGSETAAGANVARFSLRFTIRL